MTRHAVGVMNGNWRNGHYRKFIQEIEEANKRAAIEAKVVAVCQEIRDLMPDQETYDAWWEAAPDFGFLKHAQAKLAELQAEPVAPVVASALDLDPQAEARETERDMQVFGPVEPWGEFTHEDWKSENDIANECRGGL